MEKLEIRRVLAAQLNSRGIPVREEYPFYKMLCLTANKENVFMVGSANHTGRRCRHSLKTIQKKAFETLVDYIVTGMLVVPAEFRRDIRGNLNVHEIEKRKKTRRQEEIKVNSK